MHLLWKKLEWEVNHYQESLPVDSFLPDPETWIKGRRRQKVQKDRSKPVEASSIPKSPPVIERDVGENEGGPASGPEVSLDEDLRRRLTGNDFADPEEL